MMYTLNDYCRKTFGEKLYKISLDGGFTCPNRDGTLGSRGCIFCSAGGSGDFAEKPHASVWEQIESGKAQVEKKHKKGGRYIAYFQAYTNTYGPLERLEALFSEAIAHPEVVVLSIATRPDCLPLEVLQLLERLNRIKPVWVELGLQTIHESTAAFIRRGYSLPVYEHALRELKARGITVITHVILGLPGETTEDMLETVRYLAHGIFQEPVTKIIANADDSKLLTGSFSQTPAANAIPNTDNSELPLTGSFSQPPAANAIPNADNSRLLLTDGLSQSPTANAIPNTDNSGLRLTDGLSRKLHVEQDPASKNTLLKSEAISPETENRIRTDGIKLQLLYILEGTDLAAAFRKEKNADKTQPLKTQKKEQISPLTMEEYLPLLAECIRLLPEDMVIHRITGDGPKRLLIAPLWTADKKKVMNTITRYFRENNVVQGSHYF